MSELPRLKSRMLIDAIMRRVQQAGGFAVIVQRGNDSAGAIIIDCRERGELVEMLEKTTDFDGATAWRRVPAPNAAPANWADDYGRRRAESDPDLWLIELDVAAAARFADEILG